MTIDEFLPVLQAIKPGFEPFANYVSGMTKADVPASTNVPLLRAAVQIYFDDLEGAHDQLQSLEGVGIADYLHGIVHRREGDFWNANYWFRRARAEGVILPIDPENLTHRCQANSQDENLRAELLEEWKLVTALIFEE